MAVVDAVTRLLPNALGSETSALRDSFSALSCGLLDYPHYTRPAEFRGWRAPEVLVSGHHGEVAKWRRRAALLKTLKTRPELIEKAALTDDERRWLDDVMRVENIKS
jgi:tRNA (guanine37-N1)-methyltransferase